ncbi:MAG: hypothetical protein BGO31_12445 [Bacteroidetes bacterium 43-16]|nr:MAG: hypothetical protein BGO31_12445 [Bacteroidetes bacterium 43-16]
MKHLLKIAFTFLAATLFTAATAQSTGAFLKFDLDGKHISVPANELGTYNNFVSGDEGQKTNNEHAFYTNSSGKQAYKLDIMIHTPAHANPVVGKLPFVGTIYKTKDPAPAVYLYMEHTVGAERNTYCSTTNSTGYFEITKVAAGWVEGKFEINIAKQFEDQPVLHITNGSFRFKIDKEM